MIVYNRQIKNSDINNLKFEEELIYYKDNNIAYIITKIENIYRLEHYKDRIFVKKFEENLKYLIDN